MQTTISPDAEATKYKPELVDASATAAGFTRAELEAAQKWVVGFIAAQQAHSISLDSDEGWTRWQADQARELFLPSQYDSLVSAKGKTGDRSAVIFNNPGSVMPSVVRDGNPRTMGTAIEATSVEGGTDGTAGAYVWVRGVTEANYRVTDEVAVPWAMAVNDNALGDVLRESAPGLFDGEENAYEVTMNWSYAVVRHGDSWQVGGYDNDFSSSGFVQALAE